MQLGARWGPSLKFEAQQPDSSYPYDYYYPPNLHVGYPSKSSSTSSPGENGHPVLLLKTFAGDSSLRLPEYNAPEKPDDWSRLAACGTMKERYAVLRDFGATEWDDVKKCPDITQSLQEGMAEGKNLARKNVEELIHKYKIALQQAYDDYLSKLLVCLNPVFDEVNSFRAGYKAVYRASRRATPGSIETLLRLRKHGYRICVITNGQTEDQAAKAEDIGILHLVDRIITWEEAGYRKPDRRIFQYAMK
ncbi:Hypothetical protein NCS54_01300800 [Fusarium falciforme]|uniref:Hypothetical protein n=1 Tax=Fusarium falciforme TaxID=195108 RepID=UPI002300F8A0|nr:Hypothetical protein NCS54_01300800 [Fusarium falciforme]WAO95388.1 Hypothetical protein NCS54_01300800 [Fusarium falciforme]